jgi:hypothetical protein
MPIAEAPVQVDAALAVAQAWLTVSEVGLVPPDLVERMRPSRLVAGGLEQGEGLLGVSQGVVVAVLVLFGALLAAGGLFHSVLDSLLMFAALHAGSVPFGYADWAGALAWSVFGNLLGGVGLVTFIRLVRVPHRVAEERRRNT